MIINKENNLERLNNGDYKWKGNIETNEDLIIELDDRLVVEGYVNVGGRIESAKTLIAGRGIKAGDGIEAGWSIKAGRGIKAGWSIKAGLSIKAKFLDIGLRIFAGLCLWKNPNEEETYITCEELRNGEIAYGKLNLIPKTEEKEEVEIIDEKYEETKPITKESIEALGYACGEIQKCFLVVGKNR